MNGDFLGRSSDEYLAQDHRRGGFLRSDCLGDRRVRGWVEIIAGDRGIVAGDR
jgi:hypothetical protein